jgi:GDP-L-fucose synthase
VVEILAEYTGMRDRVIWERSKPNGQIYRAYDVSRLRDAGFVRLTSPADGLRSTYDWYAAHSATARK